MKLSVIIPCYNREKIVACSLKAISRQSLSREQYEVLVINDGSLDQTGEIAQEICQKEGFSYLEHKNAGVAVTRNRGIREAQNEIIVFIQDDILVSPNFLAEHLAFHQKFNSLQTGVVGYTTWAEGLRVTPFMEWLEHGGPQFDYDRLAGKTQVDYLAFYTSNLSLRRDFVLQNGLLDEEFSLPGITAYEDTEWGYRLFQKGLQLYYNPCAKAGHYHQRDLAGVCRRREKEGQMSHLLYKKHPRFRMTGKNDDWRQSLRHFKSGFLPENIRMKLASLVLNPVVMFFLRPLAFWAEKRISLPLVFKLTCASAYLRGWRKKNIV